MRLLPVLLSLGVIGCDGALLQAVDQRGNQRGPAPDELELSLYLGEFAPISTLEPNEITRLTLGVTVEGSLPFANLAACSARLNTSCAEELPSAGETVPPGPLFNDLGLQTFDPGTIVAIGTTAEFLEPFGRNFNFTNDLVEPPADLTITGGLLGEFSEPDAFDVVGDVTVLFPSDISADVPQVQRGDWLPVAWISSGPGDTHIEVFANTELEPGFEFSQGILGVEDVGFVDIEVDDLGIQLPLTRFFVEVQRNLFDNIDVNGANVSVHTQRVEFIVVEYLDPTGRTELARHTLAEDCSDAVATLPVGEGEFFGNLKDFTNDLEVDVDGSSLPGADGVVRLELAAGETLEVDYDLATSFPGLYLLEGACDVTNVVAAARNTQPRLTSGDATSTGLTFTNDTGAAQTYFLVFDAEPVTDVVDAGYFLASISIQ